MIAKIGLDLGYSSMTLSDSTAGIYREPSVALVYKDARADSKRIIAVGNEALCSDSSVSGSADGILVRPFKNGMLFDHSLTGEIIVNAIGAVGHLDGVRCIVAVPSDFLPTQEKELFDLLSKAGVKNSIAVSRPIAALVGAGYSPAMSVISVNIGAKNTEIAILNSGNVIHKATKEIGGEDFDKAVKQYVLNQGDVNISLSVAKAIKEKLGAVWKGKENDSIDIEGTLSLTGNKLRMNITTEDIVGVFEEPMQKLIMAIVGLVKLIPSDMVEAIFENGIVLSGGGAELFGIDKMMEKVLDIPVTKAQDPIDCVAKGLSRINSFVPDDDKLRHKNITNQIFKMYNSRNNK